MKKITTLTAAAALLAGMSIASAQTPPSSLQKGSDGAPQSGATSAKTGSAADPKGPAMKGNVDASSDKGTSPPSSLSKGSESATGSSSTATKTGSPADPKRTTGQGNVDVSTDKANVSPSSQDKGSDGMKSGPSAPKSQ